MATDAQIEANMLNSTRSTGPRTHAGKESSRRNALKLGLTGKGIVLPEAEAQAVADRAAAWGASYRLTTVEDHWLMEQVALETVRIDRCHEEERSLRIQRADRAELCWDDDRTREARELFAKLAKRPDLVSIALELTPQGCDLLIERWESLAAVLQSGKPWDEDGRSLAKDLLGIPLMLREAPSCIDPEPGEDAVELQRSLARNEAARLAARKIDALDELDEQERDIRILGLAAPDREIKRLLRYEAGCHRRYQAASRRLQSLRLSTPAMPAPQAKTSPAVAVDPESFRLVPESEPVDLFAEPVEEGISSLDEIVANLEAVEPRRNFANAVPREATEPAVTEERPAPTPAPIADRIESPAARTFKGNRRHRKAQLHRARQLAK